MYQVKHTNGYEIQARTAPGGSTQARVADQRGAIVYPTDGWAMYEACQQWLDARGIERADRSAATY